MKQPDFSYISWITPEEFYTDPAVTCCITGHRNKDLPFGGDESKAGMKRLLSMLYLKITEAYKEGYRTFISGMAEGVDLQCAKIISELISRGEMPGAGLVCAIPYKEQSDELKRTIDKYIYSCVLSQCAQAVVVSERKNKERYRLRNKFMVDNSTRIIGALKNKKSGSGTLQTINFAKKAGLDMKIIMLDENPLLYAETENE